MLRAYQQRAIDDLYRWFESHDRGNPCLVLPTGSGKSHIVAAICKDAIQQWPETSILMLTHQKELIEQNAAKLRQHWPGAPMGIYSAGIGKRQLGEPITFAGIQSVRKKAAQIGHVDLLIIDECHLVNHHDAGGYRTLIGELTAINPALRVVGLTATPYRLGHGMITDEPAIFHDLIEPARIDELMAKGFLATLRSKITGTKLDTSGVHKRGGEFIESELQAAVDVADLNRRVVAEIIGLAGDRRSWLFFCTGVDHAHHIAAELEAAGVVAACVTGKTPKAEREAILSRFRAGEIRALTNANVLTTGFDHPGIDLIAMLRPTMSPGLYVQMAGRGMRVSPGKSDCLVLDFAGVVATHGPIVAVRTPEKAKGGAPGEAPTKTCEQCGEICHAAVRECPACGAEFPRREDPDLALRQDDIMGLDALEMEVTGWRWRRHVSRSSGKAMLACTYYGDLSDPPVTEYPPVLHGGYVGERALRLVVSLAKSAGVDLDWGDEVDETGLDAVASQLTRGAPPALIRYRREGRFYRVAERLWP